ncbi:tetratricopeptide repeat protein [bacterium]|nr:tetratricopeptide repeat protein [bacterium]
MDDLEHAGSSKAALDPLLAGEYLRAAGTWRKRGGRFMEMLKLRQVLGTKDVEELSAWLPPHDLDLRFDLERMTKPFEDTIRIGGEETADLFARGEAMCDRGDFDIGLNVLKKVVQRNSQYFPGHVILGYVYMMHHNDYENAANHLARALNFVPTQNADHFRAFILYLMGHSHYRAGRPGNALQAFRQVRRLSPATPGVLYHIARLYSQTGQTVDAMRHLENMLRVQPELFFLAMTDDGFKRVQDEALETFATLTGDLGTQTTQLMGKLMRIVSLATKHNLHEDDPDLALRMQIAQRTDKLLKKNQFSVYRQIALYDLPELEAYVPETIHEALRHKMHATSEQIVEYNRRIAKKWRAWRNRFLLLTLGPFFAACVALLLVLLEQRISTNAAFLWSIFIYIAGASGVGIYVQRRFHRFRSAFKGTEEVDEIRGDSQEVAKLMNELGAGLVRMTWHPMDETE